MSEWASAHPRQQYPHVAMSLRWVRTTNRADTVHVVAQRAEARTQGAAAVDAARRCWRNTAQRRGLAIAAVLLAVSCGTGAAADADAERHGAGAPDADPDASRHASPLAPVPVGATQDADLLQTVQSRGVLNCGVYGAAVAFSETQPDGSTTGFDADYCRALAIVMLGDADAVRFVPLTSAERFTALQTGLIDVLVRNTTWTQSRDGDLGFDFAPVTFYDGQQLMGRVSDGFTAASTVADIAGARVCATAGTTTEKNIADAADAAGVEIKLATYEDLDITTDSFVNGTCDLMTTDGSGLVGRKARQQGDQQWVIFPSAPFSKEPLAPVYVRNQSTFGDIVNWTIYATIIFDEKGITSRNVDDLLGAGELDAEAVRLLGGEGELQTKMGVAADAFYEVVRQVGNYDEIYARNLAPVGLQRAGTPNARWTQGGLIYAPPAR
ncbi:transporter substrate-binding domain-containing protein [Candidatus Poriferisodalis sp.]|uniref:transporter substrate-binding domain-containing protein n=1 Tax=Candidatus Poriferisodalis sp. TaxID=3101277 RepID=UPI003B016C93